MEKAITKPGPAGLATAPQDAHTQAKVIESLVLRGDLSGLGPLERAKFYVQMCEGLGLNPASQPFAFLRLNGKEVLYATRGATDQLAAMHKLNREVIDGPKVIDLAGTKMVYAVCKATLPGGRFETATATVPLVDPVNVLMKCETKAKRRATLSILGLGVLDEMELETIPARAQEPGAGVDLSRVQEPGDARPADDVPQHLEEVYARIGEIEMPGEAIAVWMKHRAELAAVTAPEREAVWKALCKQAGEVGKMKNAAVWLKKAIAEEDARRGTEGPSSGDDSSDDAPEQEGPSSRAFGGYCDAIFKAPSLAEVHNLYNGLVDDLREEGNDPEHFTQGDDGAGVRAFARMKALGHLLSREECGIVLRDRPFAEVLDTQAHVAPGPDALKAAARWWIDRRTDRATLDQAYQRKPWLPLVRRYSGATDAPKVKAAGAALEAAIKALDPKPPAGGNGGARGRAANDAAGGGAEASGGDGAAAASSDVFEALALRGSGDVLLAWAEKLRDTPQTGDDRGAAHVAGSYWKRRDAWKASGHHARAYAITLDELASRGVGEPHTFLDGVGERNGATTRNRPRLRAA